MFINSGDKYRGIPRQDCQNERVPVVVLRSRHREVEVAVGKAVQWRRSLIGISFLAFLGGGGATAQQVRHGILRKKVNTENSRKKTLLKPTVNSRDPDIISP